MKMLGYGSILGGGGAGAGAGAGLGTLCGVVTMPSLYRERRREAAYFEYDPDEATDQVALQGSYAVPVVRAPLAVGLGKAYKENLRVVTIGERSVVERLGVDAESEVAGRQHKDRSEQRTNGPKDADTRQDGVCRPVGERETGPDGRLGE